jgi:sugar phosphate isomerase/epimerase
MAIGPNLVCSSHTISGVLPGARVPARHSFEERVAACSAAGYVGMCLHFRDYRALRQAGHTDAELRAVLHRHGMTDVSLEFLTDWFLTGSQAQQARLDEETVYAAGRAYGAHTVNVGSDFKGRGIPRRSMREMFAALCKRAGEHGLKVALEIVPWSDVRNIDDAMATIDGIENAGLVIDSWHVFRGGIALADLERIPGSRVLCIQVSDAEATVRGSLAEDTTRRRPCGEGVFDLDGFLNSLGRTGTSAPVSVEIISADFAQLDVNEAARKSIEGAKALVGRHLGRPGRHVAVG